MGTITLDIPVNKSPVPAALDMFYDFLVTNIPPGPNDRIAILGTLVEFDIDLVSVLYNDFVVRAFADRTVLVSPTPGQAAGDFADRYSSRYTDMLVSLVAAIDAELDQPSQNEILRHEAAIDAISADRDKYLDQIETAWSTEMVRLGIDPTKIDTDEKVRQRYATERVKFLTTRRYAQRVWGIDGFNTKIRQREILIGSIRRKAFPDNDYAQLYHQYEWVLENRVIRPRTPDLEITHKWDAVTIQDPTNYALQAVLDIAVHTSSIVDPRTILKGAGKRGYSVSTTSTITKAHDKAWQGSVGGSYSFFSGSVSTQNETHFRSSLTKVRNVSVNFEHLGELQIMRDQWFASTSLSDNKRVRKFLKSNPALAKKLSILTTGIIIGRGLNLTLEFTDSSDVQEWGSSSTSGSAGVNVFGVQLGGSGGSSSSYNNHEIDTTARTVTFRDDPTVCRLVGLRTTALDTGSSTPFYSAMNEPAWQSDSIVEAISSQNVAGKVIDLYEALIAQEMRLGKS